MTELIKRACFTVSVLLLGAIMIFSATQNAAELNDNLTDNQYWFMLGNYQPDN
ncbi:hypothetical protein [Psychromonas hadalis]|uniref:hypothetical protein n=1 Tax=Psychromonas hadalis TaxID=211669 RepID=UPI0003B77552|nr:hypothetical protein [Psychromonas hadalis]